MGEGRWYVCVCVEQRGGLGWPAVGRQRVACGGKTEGWPRVAHGGKNRI